MAKFTTVGYMAVSKKDATKRNIVLKQAVPAGTLILQKKPTEEDIEASKSDKQREALTKRAAQWPEWKVADVVLIEDGE